jgi:hypothetical protein
MFDNNEFVDYLNNLNSSCLLKELNFQYVTEEQLTAKLKKLDRNIELSVFHMNIRSLNSKQRQICQLFELLDYEFDVIILTEIWTVNINFYANLFTGYDFYYDLPQDSKVGGVGLFIRNTCTVHELPQYQILSTRTSVVENKWVEVTKESRKYIIGGIYRHPNQNIADFTSLLEPVLNSISDQKLPCIIAGDINIDLTKSRVNENTSRYVDSLLTNNFLPTVLMPTRITPSSATLIDHMYYFDGCGSQNKVAQSGNLLADISDHLPNFMLILHDKMEPAKRPKIRIMSNKNREKFCEKISSTDWSAVYAEPDVNTAYNTFINTVTNAFYSCFPLKTLSRKRSRDKKWITAGLKKCSNTKNKLYKKWITKRNPEDEKAYRQYRAIYRKVAAEAESDYYKQMFDMRSNSIKQLWTNLNIVCSFKNKRKRNNIAQLNVGDNLSSDATEISNYINRYFANIGNDLQKKFENSHSGVRSSDANEFWQYCNNSINKSMFVRPVDAAEVMHLICQLNGSKSPGPDDIGPRLIKDSATALCQPLVHIFNLSFTTGIVPDQLKIAKVIPVFKKGDSKLASNYRPISLLSIFDKLLERAMRNRLYYHLQINNLIYKYQFGFRHNHSTTLAVIDVIDSIYERLDNGEKIIGLYFDLQKAFDTVNHEILLCKLQKFGVRGIVHDWFKNYLSDRYQYTLCNSIKSEMLEITCGVPQGSVLGPLLFLVYMNDINVALQGQKVKLFADDTNLFISGNNLSEASELAAECIDKLSEWFTINKLTLNIDKTCFMVFPPDKTNSVHLSVNGKAINKVQSCRYLGVIIDDELKWTDHIHHVYKKLIKYVGIFYKLRNKLPSAMLKNIYYAFVHSYLLYAVEVYANTCPTYLDKLVKLNNKLLRILQNKPLLYPVSLLYDEFKTLPLTDLHKQQLLLLAYKLIHLPQNLPEIFKNYLESNECVHEYNTRSKADLHLHRAETTYGQRCLKYKLVTLWNELPQTLKESDSVSSLKDSIRAYLT